jgi:hypothetical protein
VESSLVIAKRGSLKLGFWHQRLSESGACTCTRHSTRMGAEIPHEPSSYDDRTLARRQALNLLNQLQTGGGASGGSSIHGTLLPRGGVNGMLGQWVYIVAVELWVPAEEVMRDYQSMQRTFLANPNPPKTSARSFKVAAFVWQNELVHSTRPPWPVLCERWNNWPLTKPFKNWQSFRRSFVRGAEATPPRYRMTDAQITDQVRSRSYQGAFDLWASRVRK